MLLRNTWHVRYVTVRHNSRTTCRTMKTQSNSAYILLSSEKHGTMFWNVQHALNARVHYVLIRKKRTNFLQLPWRYVGLRAETLNINSTPCCTLDVSGLLTLVVPVYRNRRSRSGHLEKKTNKKGNVFLFLRWTRKEMLSGLSTTCALLSTSPLMSFFSFRSH